MVSAYYLDSSVAIHVLERTPAAAAWFEGAVAVKEISLFSSRLLRLELTRVLRREDRPVRLRENVLVHVNWLALTEQVMIQAEAIGVHVKTLDAIHLASALGSGLDPIVATHDARMIEVANTIGLATFDPLAA